MAFLDRLHRPEPLITLELRPPRKDLEEGLTIDTWMAMARAVRRVLTHDTALFFTDNAVGAREEENLHHLASNLADDLPRDRVCTFLTTKHTLEYCLWYADRAVTEGYSALTVLGGDTSVGPSRCVPHAFLLRQELRRRHPHLALGGWANPYRSPEQQVGYLVAPEATADFFLTQTVSHYDLDPVARFLEESDRQGLALPGVFGVFYYRSARPATLTMLSQFLHVPAEALTRDFAKGRHADDICAETVRALRDLGVPRVYVSNLRPEDAVERLEAIRARV